jgi:hypothetical protein
VWECILKQVGSVCAQELLICHIWIGYSGWVEQRCCDLARLYKLEQASEHNTLKLET